MATWRHGVAAAGTRNGNNGSAALVARGGVNAA